jgi:hypothetical protein
LQHAVGYVTGEQFYGAKASLNVWPAKVASAAEFSLSQIWVISGSFGNDLNTIEAGWQVRTLRYVLAAIKTALLIAAVRTCMCTRPHLNNLLPSFQVHTEMRPS